MGKPIHLDQATINIAWPSWARVKVLVDLKGTFPKVVQINIENDKTGEVRTIMVNIRYDYVPKYCCEWKMQGHDKDTCRFLKHSRSNEKQNSYHVNWNSQNHQQNTQAK